jgi:hypothetical protein
MIHSARLIGYKKPVNIPAETPEELIAYCARRSSGKPRDEWHEVSRPVKYDGKYQGQPDRPVSAILEG